MLIDLWHHWLLLRPLLVFVLAGPLLVFALLSALLARGRGRPQRSKRSPLDAADPRANEEPGPQRRVEASPYEWRARAGGSDRRAA